MRRSPRSWAVRCRRCCCGASDSRSAASPDWLMRHIRGVRRRTARTSARRSSKTLTTPADTTHWSTRRLAKEVGASPTTVHRIWRTERLKPHRTETFKFSRDPDLVPKVIDIVGRYLHRRRARSCSASMSRPRSRSRTQPMLPMRPGQVERHTHDYRRNGTVDLYAALEVATGTVTGRTTARHRAKEFLDFCRVLVRRTPPGSCMSSSTTARPIRPRPSAGGCAGTSGSTSTSPRPRPRG